MATRKTYWELLQDPRWQKRRLQIMGAANFTCEWCEATDKTLNVHHKIYRKGANPWEYQDSELLCICRDCHEIHNGWRSRLDEALAAMDCGSMEELVGYAEGLMAREYVFGDNLEKEELAPAKSWPLRSWEHARGFLVAVASRVPHLSVESLIEAAPITDNDIWHLGRQEPPSSLAAFRKLSEQK